MLMADPVFRRWRLMSAPAPAKQPVLMTGSATNRPAVSWANLLWSPLLKSPLSTRFRPSTRNSINTTSCYLAAPTMRSLGRWNSHEVAQVKICKCSDMGGDQTLRCLRVSFQPLVRGKQTQLIRQEITGSMQGWVERNRQWDRSLGSFSVICAFRGKKMQSRKYADVRQAGAAASLVAVGERTMNKLSAVPRRLPSIMKHKVSVLCPVCREHQITF